MTKPTLTHADLRQFHGDLERFRTIHPNIIYTPGVQYLAEAGSAYWLIDAIASHFPTDKMRKAFREDGRTGTLHFWRLQVDQESSSATLTATADKGEPPFIIQQIEFTDFPLSEVEVWAGFDGSRWTLYLPSEH